MQGMLRDFDNDGFQDILVSGDRLDYYHNNGDKTFTKTTPFGNVVFGSFALGDLNRDGSVSYTHLSELEAMLKVSGLQGTIEATDKVKHLEYIILSLGTEESGIAEVINDKLHKPLIKTNGSLIYQQLYNGKVQVMIVYPFIEGFGEPRPPKVISIYRPEEIKTPFLLRHMEEFIKEIDVYKRQDRNILCA